MARIETTDDDFIFFMNEFRMWVEYWGLKDWQIDAHFTFNPAMDKDDPPLGSINAMYADKYAVVYFCPICPDSIYSEEEIAKTAFHEAAELLMMEFWLLANARHGTTEEQLTKACHDVIHRLTNTTFEEYWASRDCDMFEIEFNPEESEEDYEQSEA